MTLLEKCVAELLDGMEAQFPSQVPVCLRQKAELAQEITAEVMNNPNLKLLVAEAAKLVLLDRHGGEFLFDRLLNISDDIWEQAKVRFQEPQLRQALSDFDLGSFSEAELCALKEAAAAEVAAAHETPGSENLGSDGMVAAFLRQAIRKILGMPLGVSP